MNNNLHPSTKRKCNCGRYMTLGEDKSGIGVLSYECPDCSHRRYSNPLSNKKYYEQFERVLK
jgi:hypothetical protein